MQRFTKITVKEIVQYGCLLAFAMVVSYVEVLLPVPIGIPGVKLGLANAAIVLCLYLFGAVPALVINLLRVLLCSLLFANLYSLWYSLAGAVFSFFIMILCKKIKNFSMIGVSALGGVFHNIGQLMIALVITEVPVLLYYVPVLIVLGTITGFINGGLAKIIYGRVYKHITQSDKEREL